MAPSAQNDPQIQRSDSALFIKKKMGVTPLPGNQAGKGMMAPLAAHKEDPRDQKVDDFHRKRDVNTCRLKTKQVAHESKEDAPPWWPTIHFSVYAVKKPPTRLPDPRVLAA